MLLLGYKHSSYNHLVAPARLARDLRQAFLAAVALCSSLLPSYCVSSLLSEVRDTDLKKSGLLPSVPSSATLDLAYLPCRIGRDGSTILFLSGGGIAKKTPLPAAPPEPGFLYGLVGEFIPHLSVFISRSASMRFENHHDAAKLFSFHPRVFCPAPIPRTPPTLRSAAAGGRPPLEPRASSGARPRVPGQDPFLPRCCQKACVFPALPGARGECAYHRRQSLEPGCFQSVQPSFLLLDQAKFGLPDSEPDDGRVRDRRRLAAERMRFMLGDAA